MCNWRPFRSSGPYEATSRAQVAAAAGYSAKSGGFNNLLSQLASAGIVTYPVPGMLSLANPDAANLMDAETAKQKMMASLTAAVLLTTVWTSGVVSRGDGRKDSADRLLPP
jgi:hypothetical protein